MNKSPVGFWRVFKSWKMAVCLLQGFSSGLPLALTGATLQAWMTDAQVDLKTIGLFSLVGLPYSFKFLWAPLLDRFTLPVPGLQKSRRRGWILIAQILISICLIAFSLTNPSELPLFLALAAVMVAFWSATQDLMLDAYRIELLNKEEYGAGASLFVTGYRLAMLFSGGGALILAAHFPWATVYQMMAASMLLMSALTFFAPEPTQQVKAPRTLVEAFVEPFKEFFGRKGAFEVLSFSVLYKLDVVLAMALLTPFFLHLGFSKEEVGVVLKGVGLYVTIAGGLVGGALIPKLGLKRALWIFGIAQGGATFSLMALAHFGKSFPLMISAVAIENFCSGLGNAAFAAFLMGLCNKRYSATQYALLSSLMAVPRTLMQAPSGYLVEAMGWELYFLLAAAMTIPGLLLLTRFDRWKTPEAV